MSKLLDIVEGRFDADRQGPTPEYEKTWRGDPASGALDDPSRPTSGDEEDDPEEEEEDDVVSDPEEDFQSELCDLLTDELQARCQTFADAGVMTRNKGLVVRLQDGRKFQLCIVQDNRGY